MILITFEKNIVRIAKNEETPIALNFHLKKPYFGSKDLVTLSGKQEYNS